VTERSTGDAAVWFDGVTKAFRAYDQKPFIVRTALRGLIGRAPPQKRLVLLDDASFVIAKGETVGVLGVNGAGKSTMLRLMAGSCMPTSGTVTVRGRVAPVLALGIGFHPDMTGLECIELNAIALGFTRKEVREREAPIVEFAELGDAIHKPLRYYSSGMQARLGFSIAIHSDPDVLLLDEVLSVGDAQFQQRCRLRIASLHEDGVTIILVSHDAETVARVCSRALWLKEGKIVRDGPAADTVAEYMAAG